MFYKGQPKLAGRQKGTRNKISCTLREMVIGALSEVGGQQYLTQQARENPTAFLTLLAKTLPRELKTADDKPLQHVVEVVHRICSVPSHPNRDAWTSGGLHKNTAILGQVSNIT